MRSQSLVMALALFALVPCAGAGEETPDVLGADAVQIAEGVYESTDAEGVRHLQAVGEEGLWWNIRRYEATLQSLADERGIVAEEDTEKARFLSERLSRLYEIASYHDNGDFDVRGQVRDGDCDDGTDPCSKDFPPDEYQWNACADAEYDPPYTLCGVIRGGELGLRQQFSVGAWSEVDLDDCKVGWTASGYVHAFLTGEDPESDSDSGRNFSIAAAVPSYTEPDCRYGLAELWVYNPRTLNEYYYCEAENPSGCCDLDEDCDP
jgi:hypothetical protein